MKQGSEGQAIALELKPPSAEGQGEFNSILLVSLLPLLKRFLLKKGGRAGKTSKYSEHAALEWGKNPQKVSFAAAQGPVRLT